MTELDQYYSKAATLCSKSEKCSSDILQKIKEWGATEELSRKVVKKLIAEKFIDDARYASFYVKDKFRFNKWGKIKIAFMLRQKQLSADIIHQVLDEIDEEEYLETLKKLLEEKAKKTKFSNLYDKKAKLLRFAQSHGFESDLVFRAMKE